MASMTMSDGAGPDTSLESNSITGAVPPNFADPNLLINYIRRISVSILEEEESQQSTAALQAVLVESAELIRKFTCDPQVKALFVQKISNKDEDREDEYTVSAEVRFSSVRAVGLILTKRSNFIEADKSFGSQVRTVVLNDGSPYETLHSYISMAVAPFFKSYLQGTGHASESTQSTSDKLAPSVEKKLAELEMGLLHLQQNIDIPEISLIIHPLVAQTVSMCAEENRRPRVADFGDQVDDSSFLNALQQGVNRWVKEIQKVTKLDRDPSSGTTLQEVSFWLNLERALVRLQEKRESLEVELTLDVLRHGKRFHATVSFDTDTGLKQAIATVNDYSPLMKDFPIHDLLAATDLEKVRFAIQGVFVHLKKIRTTKYPIQRALRLVEAISRDLSTQLLKVLGTRRLMNLPFEEFERVMNSCFDIFNTWDEEFEKLQGLLRDVMKKKRDEMKMIWRIIPAHKKLQGRMEQVRKFRRQHEQLRSVIERVLRPDQQTMVEGNANEEVSNAYILVEEVDVLEMSKDGAEAWDAAVRRYNERVDTVEAKITAALREQLATAKSANEMFRIFARFNALFVRPQIRGAIREYQTQLIQRVKEDIDVLHEKFKTQYSLSKSNKMSHLHDIPPVSGSIIWAKQIDRQLTTYLRRVEAILGSGWENHVEGQKLKSDGDSFRIKLNTQPIFEDWVAKVQQKDTAVSGRIFDIEQVRARGPSGKQHLKLKVNFLPEIITLSKEVRHLKNLGFRVPLAIMNKAHQANQMYPFAISLMESVRSYERSWEKIEDKANVALLVAGVRQEVHTLISEGMGLVWESYKLDPYVKKLSESVFQFSEKVEEVLNVEAQVSVDIKSLETCPYSAKTFADILAKIQKAVDDLSLKQYSNLSRWVQHIDVEVEKRLAVRLEAGIAAWTAKLEGHVDNEDNDTDTEMKPTHKLGGEPELGELRLELRMTQQTLWVYPAVEEVRQELIQKLLAWQAIATSHPRIQSSRYQVVVEKGAPVTYKDLLAKLPAGKGTLEAAYKAVEEKVTVVMNYVNEWLCYQTLWDLQPDQLYGKLGEDMTLWLACLADIKKSRSTFDTADVRRSFGPVTIEYGKVQSKVSLKYDSWHKDALAKFANLLSAQMISFHTDVAKSRTELEQRSIETSSTSEAVGLITYVQTLKRMMLEWEEKVGVYKEGQRTLERQRFQLPNNWLHIDSVEGEWSSFSEILKRKDSSIQTQVASLQAKIMSEDKAVEGRTVVFLADWDKEKPVKADFKPSEALRHLVLFETRYAKLKEERGNVSRAKEALEIQGIGSECEERFLIALEELQDLKGVWNELSKIWEQIDEMKEKPWLSIQPRKLRQQIDGLLTQMKDLPAKLRQYASYEHVKRLLQSYTKVNALIIELKSEALKERHWKSLMKALRVNWVLSELTLGQVWDIDLQRNEKILRDVIIVAQGEMALEEFLKQVKEFWTSYELELIPYQNKCKLIKGWDDLFNKLKEHINSIAAMKLSPYYKVFEEDSNSWEEKLNRILSLFDVWIDVQRRWVYLEGIFLSSQDIKALLPMETSRFQNISTEFLGLMKRVSKSPKVLDVLNIQGVQRSLERLADMLGKIQKALGEYLERERSSFPRFYFVGDEDLLEIIGNSKNLGRLQKHFKKMFAGISSVTLTEDQNSVTGMASREGEIVQFNTPVVVTDQKINEWLTKVEKEMRFTLASLLASAVAEVAQFNEKIENAVFMAWIDRFPAQLISLAAQIWWCDGVEQALGGKVKLDTIVKRVENTLTVLADSVLQEQPALRRKKLEHLINEFVHKRTVTRHLAQLGVTNKLHFEWMRQMRFSFDPTNPDVLKKLTIHMADAKFNYGFEYLGVQEKLVQTPLTDKCYLTMTQALEARLGGSPFGPAGTGKTESVKALGHQLGRFVLVFNCDETFDFQAMGRIFVGLCQVGSWGCFDEFNRLEERMLSAVSQQIQTIQEALKSQKESQKEGSLLVELVGKQVRVSSEMAIFVTMNPGYAGRSNLPDNLKQLFRSLAMTSPDRQLIAEVMLFSQGFRTAETLAAKVVPFFKLCQQQLSAQSHYDFGLRALKSVLISAGNVKRDRIQRIKETATQRGESVEESKIAENLPEQEILIQSICETMVPKLVAEDIPLLFSLLSDVFPGIAYTPAQMDSLRGHVRDICVEEFLVSGENAWTEKTYRGKSWIEKVLQLYQIQALSHGVMLVGNSGTGKSSAWRVLLKALERLEGVEGVSHVVDPKALSKEALYGFLDPNTREWTDGLFTHILRKIIDNVRGERGKRQWIVFDGDVDPEWIENLNSVLDDNKLLTLPNGERLALPPNVRLLFEVQDLKHATMATVSRCGMVWFSHDVLSIDMLFHHFLAKLQNISLDDTEEGDTFAHQAREKGTEETVSPALKLQREIAAVLQPYFVADGLVSKCLEYAATQDHIMDFTIMRALSSLFSMINESVRQVHVYNASHQDFPLDAQTVETFISKSFIYGMLWSFSGDAKLKVRHDLGEYIRSFTTIPLPPANAQIPVIDYEVTIQGEWSLWSVKVPRMEVDTHKVASPDAVVPTLDTVRHEALLATWLAEHKPLILCGPPGSGKTMTLLSALRALPDMEVVGLNFSSATSPELLLKTFDHYCEYKKTPNGIVLAPIQLGKWLILFCDEINLPDMDKYGTQRVISFLRQLVEHGCFYRTSDQAMVRLERIQFVGACNPPTDPGRKPLSHRFLRHVPVVYVDYPGETSLKQIYGTFNRAMLKLIPTLSTYAEPLTNAMVEFFLKSQERFTQDMQPHYVYSPREMTRWVRGIYEAIRPLDTLSVEGLIRLWAHEALRLFQDRLVYDEERHWTRENIDAVALKHFPTIDKKVALKRPILYSNWLSKDYVPVEREELREYVKARLQVFYQEELDVPLVLFDEVLDHVLRMDRIFRQPQGHLLLIGVAGSGKTTLSRFVAWINGLQVFQIKVHNKYTAAEFDEDLRSVLRRSGCKGEKICFILDESNVLQSSFLERMNTLLANGEVPGLFEGDEYTTLMTQCKEGAARDGLMLDSAEELYKWFATQVMRNLHVVFTMNPSEQGLKDRASTSPALFNRCVLDWFGDWTHNALFQVARELTIKVDLDNPAWNQPMDFPLAFDSLDLNQMTHRDAIVNAFVFVHLTLHKANSRLVKRGARTMAITPRHFLDFISHFVKLYNEKRSDLEDEQLHLNIGLNKIAETVEQVGELKKALEIKSKELKDKNELANLKLKEMIGRQQEAEQRKVQSQAIQQALEKQTKEIAKKQEDVTHDLEQVEPAVKDAEQAVQSIKKAQLNEIRALPNPPALVKLALESICLLLGEVTTEWGAIRKILMRENFIPTIVNFNTESITDEIRRQMGQKYLSNTDYTFEKVNNASLACGPLVKWAIAQFNYADMLKRVEPLRDELKSLHMAAKKNQTEGTQVTNDIERLEKQISTYKEEYALLIAQAQAIKSDLEVVHSKVERSMALLKSLGRERERWEGSSESFKGQMSTIVGDALLSAAFLPYAGYFDQHYRHNLITSWCEHLTKAGITYRQDLALSEYLSNPDERLRWKENSLPDDDLCTENAIMLKRFNRYPLIIDPSGQATEFLTREYADRKLTKTSFLDDSFRKNLESALRFGNPLLVQDVESYDPILNPVLNREVKRTGGRVLISLGEQDIDLSPSFVIFLSTRDPTVEFPPDVCSRVTFVNFTVTRASLQHQCLNEVLRAERPDIDQKRSDLLKLQGEFQVRLRQLEKSLLGALNEAKGKILDDDSVISTLENLKTEAAEISRKVEETDKVIAEIETVSQQYMPLAQSCSSIYFTLENMYQMHFLYQYSLQFFLDMFNSVLYGNQHLNNVKEYETRLSIITKDLFQVCSERVTRGMLHVDRLPFAMLLARIYSKGIFEHAFQLFLRFKEGMIPQVKGQIPPSLSQEQVEGMLRLQGKEVAFKNLSSKVNSQEFVTWIKSPTPETNVPVLWEETGQLPELTRTAYKLLVIQAFRPDRVVPTCHLLTDEVLGADFLPAGDVDLAKVIDQEVASRTPILLCAAPGFDASGRVDDLAAQKSQTLVSIAIGSAEGFAQADQAIASSVKTGRWVILKNVHLAPQWLLQLEKKLHSLQPHASFRLFLTMDIHPKIPVNLLRAGRVFVFEPPPGIRANLLRTFNTIPAQRMMKAPSERARLYFLVAWFHAIVQERLRYVPLGWSKHYEFNEADLRVACDTLDTWIDATAMGRTNLSPDKVPWDALKTLLADTIYGGKVDNEFDSRLLTSFVNRLFTPRSFEAEFLLVANAEGGNISMPDALRRDQFLTWANALGHRQTPAWLGLPTHAEKVLMTNRGSEMVAKLLKMQLLEDDEDLPLTDGVVVTNGEGPSGTPVWMRTVRQSAEEWLKLLPGSLRPLKRTADNIKKPLYRFFEREISVGMRLVETVQEDLKAIIQICSGEKKQTSYYRNLISELVRGLVPSGWTGRYPIPTGCTVIDWVNDLAVRIAQFIKISQTVQKDGADMLNQMTIALGGLFNPEAYFTATRQCVAQENGWSIEELVLDIRVAGKKGTFGLSGLKVQGAAWKDDGLHLSADILSELPDIALTWMRADPKVNLQDGKITLPVYLNTTRSELLFTVDMKIAKQQEKYSFYERGVAILTSML